MKIPRLHDIDLARFAMEPLKQRPNIMMNYKKGIHPYTYDPTNKVLPDILALGTDLLGDRESASWQKIKSIVRASSSKLRKSDVNERINLLASKALFDFSTKHNVRSRSFEFDPMRGPYNHEVRCWNPMVVIIDEKPHVIYFDPRASNSNLRDEARRFCFSVMHQRIRLINPDFFDVRFGIIQVQRQTKTKGKAILHTDENLDLMSYEELTESIQSTYEIWADICLGRFESEVESQDMDDLPLFALQS